jgi:hypothetical protein
MSDRACFRRTRAVCSSDCTMRKSVHCHDLSLQHTQYALALPSLQTCLQITGSHSSNSAGDSSDSEADSSSTSDTTYAAAARATAALLRQLCSSEQRRREQRAHSAPEFLLQLDAGWVLSGAVWEGVSLLEKRKQYTTAVALLGQVRVHVLEV